MEGGLRGKVIVITGGAGGIGSAACKAFARPVHALPWSIRAKRPFRTQSPRRGSTCPTLNLKVSTPQHRQCVFDLRTLRSKRNGSLRRNESRRRFFKPTSA